MSRPKTPKPERVRADATTFRQALKILGWSQAEAARQLNVHSRQRVGEWARGERPVPFVISKFLGVLVDRELRRKGL